MRNATVKWTTMIVACALALPAVAADATSWAPEGWKEFAPVMVDIAYDGSLTVYLADPPTEADPPDPDRDGYADPPSEKDGDPPTEADPPDPDHDGYADPPSEKDGLADPPSEVDPPDPDIDMHVVVDTASIGSLKITDSEGRELRLVYVGDPYGR